MEISEKELSKIIALYNNYQRLKEEIKKEYNQAVTKEYFLININWLEDFKKIFHYDSIIQLLKENSKEININNIHKLKLAKINEKDRQKIKIIKNKDIFDNSLGPDILYYYYPFFIIYPDYYEEIIDGYIIDERIKSNILISNGKFLIDLPNNVIEVGIFNTPYTYKFICLIKFPKEAKYTEEFKIILSENLFNYLKKYDITEDMVIEHKYIYKTNMTLIKLEYYCENVIPKIKSLVENEFDISNKIGFKNYDENDPNISKLNSIIQILTSIEQIYSFFNNNNNAKIIRKFNHLYVFSSFFSEAINAVYKKSKLKDFSLKQMNIILKFINSEISQKNIFEYFDFILQLLHNELIPAPCNKNLENLISFNSPFGDRIESYNRFINYYQNDYKHSPISGLFNWIMEKKINCEPNSYSTSSFQAFPYLEFNIDLLFDGQNQNEQIIYNLNNCFANFSKINIEVESSQKCPYCNAFHPTNAFIYRTPAYFIIIINRKNKITQKVKYPNELILTNYIESDNIFKSYKLIGIIKEKDNKYYSLIRNEKGTEIGKIEWKKFEDEKVTNLYLDQNIYDKNVYNEVFDDINSRILIYKGIHS